MKLDQAFERSMILKDRVFRAPHVNEEAIRLMSRRAEALSNLQSVI